MIDNREFEQLKTKAGRVVRGQLLASDRVTDRVEYLLDQVTGFPWPPSEFKEAVRLKPALARSWADSLTELRHLVGLIEDQYGPQEPPASNIRGITEEVEG